MCAVIAATAADIATDFIPGVSQAKTAYDAYERIQNGEDPVDVLMAAGGDAALGLIPGLRAAKKLGKALDKAEDVADAAGDVRRAARGGGQQPSRFVADDAGIIVDTHATPPGRYIQPDRGATDILQKSEHPGPDPFVRRTHTHPPEWNVNPNNPAQRSLKLGEPRAVTTEEVFNIMRGSARRAVGRGRG
jgi:hypothetical protein